MAYGIPMTCTSGAFTLIRIWLARSDSLIEPDLRPRLARALRRSALGPAAYATATVLATVTAPAAFALFTAIAAYFPASGRHPTDPPTGA